MASKLYPPFNIGPQTHNFNPLSSSLSSNKTNITNQSNDIDSDNQDQVTDSNPSKTFIDYIKLILNTIGLNKNQVMYDNILNKMDTLNTDIKNNIINDESLITKINLLLNSDNKFKEIGDNMISKLKNSDTIKKWETVMGRLAELQGLVILKKISKNDSHIIIDSLLYALDNKIKTINSILDDTSIDNTNTNQMGGSVNNVENLIKYLINKNKILKFLKNNI